jgi:peptidase M42 family hydrolase
VSINAENILKTLKELLDIPSPSGHTDAIVQYVSKTCQSYGLVPEMTRKGGLRVPLINPIKSSDKNPKQTTRALAAHVDTLGAMIRELKPNGRCGIWPIGHWNARFAAGARVSIFADGGKRLRGTILPLKASGHVYNEQIDSQESSWDHLELRVDEEVDNEVELIEKGLNVGDYIAVDSQPEFLDNGYINARHLDNKAGVACLLEVARVFSEQKLSLPIDCYLLFTISEEVGSGASAILHGAISELVSIDNATPAPNQNSIETGVTIGMMDSSGPFDFHLTHKLIALCQQHDIEHARDVFKYYRTDAASAIEAGNDIRTALLCFGADASHGWERTHIRSLTQLSQLIMEYIHSGPVMMTDCKEIQKVDERFFEDNAQIVESE